MIPISYYLILSTIIFTISIAGIFLNRKNILVLLMSLELMFLSVNFNLITLGNYLGDLTGQVFVFFVLTVVAAESAIGLALLIVLFRSKKSIDVDDFAIDAISDFSFSRTINMNPVYAIPKGTESDWNNGSSASHKNLEMVSPLAKFYVCSS